MSIFFFFTPEHWSHSLASIMPLKCTDKGKGQGDEDAPVKKPRNVFSNEQKDILINFFKVHKWYNKIYDHSNGNLIPGKTSDGYINLLEYFKEAVNQKPSLIGGLNAADLNVELVRDRWCTIYKTYKKYVQAQIILETVKKRSTGFGTEKLQPGANGEVGDELPTPGSGASSSTTSTKAKHNQAAVNKQNAILATIFIDVPTINPKQVHNISAVGPEYVVFFFFMCSQNWC